MWSPMGVTGHACEETPWAPQPAQWSLAAPFTHHVRGAHEHPMPMGLRCVGAQRDRQGVHISVLHTGLPRGWGWPLSTQNSLQMQVEARGIHCKTHPPKPALSCSSQQFSVPANHLPWKWSPRTQATMRTPMFLFLSVLPYSSVSKR